MLHIFNKQNGLNVGQGRKIILFMPPPLITVKIVRRGTNNAAMDCLH
jgi:hypothetical protein